MDEKRTELAQLIYSLEYYVEDVGTMAGDLLSLYISELQAMIDTEPNRVRRLSIAMLEIIQEQLVSDQHLRKCFPAYCELIGVEWVDE